MSDNDSARRLMANLDEAFDIVAVRIVNTATGFIPRAPWVVRSLLFSLYVFLFMSVDTLLFRGVLRGQGADLNSLIYLQIWIVVLLLSELIAFDLVRRSVLDIFEKSLVPNFSSGLVERITAFLETFKQGRRRQIVVAGVSGLVVTGLLGELLSLNFRTAPPGDSGVWLPAGYIGIFVVSAIITNMIHLATLFTSLTMLMSQSEELEPYPLDPKYSPLVRGSAAIARRIVWMTTVTASISVIGPFLLPQSYQLRQLGTDGILARLQTGDYFQPDLLTLVLSLLAFIVAVGAVFLQFAVQQYSLSRFVARRRDHTLAELQADLRALYDRRAELDDQQRKQFDHLLALHDRIKQASGRAFNFGDALRFVSPLLLALLSLISTTSPIILALRDWLAGITQ